jgi:hypothetical protein
MSTMLNRTRSVLALGIAVLFVAVGSLAGAPTASACGITDDGRCLVTPIVIRTDPPLKPKHHAKKQTHARSKQAPIGHLATTCAPDDTRPIGPSGEGIPACLTP